MRVKAKVKGKAYIYFDMPITLNVTSSCFDDNNDWASEELQCQLYDKGYDKVKALFDKMGISIEQSDFWTELDEE